MSSGVDDCGRLQRSSHFHAAIDMEHVDYITLSTPCGAWERANASSGGLLDWAIVEIDNLEFLQRRPALCQSTKRVRTRLMREEAVTIFLAKRGPKSNKTTSLLATEILFLA